MKKIFSIILPLLLLSGGIVLAFNVPVTNSICEEENHLGFTYIENETPPANSSPDELPDGMEQAGRYGEDFSCDETSNLCHWAYDEEQSAWVPCNTGNLVPSL